MSRVAMTGLLVASFLAGAPGSPPAAAAHAAVPTPPSTIAAPLAPERTVQVTGTLMRATLEGMTPYEVNGYLLQGVPAGELERLVGREVVVKGTLVSGPSIFMRRLLQVHAIALKDAISIPAEPPYRLLFGRIERDCDGFYLVEREGGPRLRLQGMDLSHLLGQPAALAADEEVRHDGVRVYHVYRAVPLGGDLTPYLGTIYHRPERPIAVVRAGEPVAMEQAPIMANGRVLVELRAVAVAFGAHIDWDGARQEVHVRKGGRLVTLRIGSPEVMVQDGENLTAVFTADVAPVLLGGRTMVPIRVLADGLGQKVTWDPTTWTVELS